MEGSNRVRSLVWERRSQRPVLLVVMLSYLRAVCVGSVMSFYMRCIIEIIKYLVPITKFIIYILEHKS